MTDPSIDEAGNLWMPRSAGSLYRIDAEKLTREEPALIALTSDVIGHAVKLTLNTVKGPTYIAPRAPPRAVHAASSSHAQPACPR
ncbi:hypothetical protein WME76_22320 [Sorangium sp. So ce119]|uniref:hypothetical protein n=1 Tax=Sorangium sp. So ce119 TaxID=3133279 RepID=UPI003F5F2424